MVTRETCACVVFSCVRKQCVDAFFSLGNSTVVHSFIHSCIHFASTHDDDEFEFEFDEFVPRSFVDSTRADSIHPSILDDDDDVDDDGPRAPAIELARVRRER